jgi:hypothetical protein
MVNVGDVRYEELLNLAIIIADPSEKNPAHITVSGPFERRPALNRQQSGVSGETVSILGVSSFIGESQNTVYLECGFPSARAIWNKKSYGFKPHLTIYDGTNSAFAKTLLKTLKNPPRFFHFPLGDFFYYSSVFGQKDLEMAMHINFSLLSHFIDGVDSLEDLNDIPYQDRAGLIGRILDRCSEMGL